MDPLTLFFIALALMVISYVITMSMMKKPSNRPAALEDFEFPTSDEGTPQTVVFGDVWLTGPMVITYVNFRTKKIKSKGKK